MRSVVFFLLLIGIIYHVNALIQHGLDPTLWQLEVMRPGAWFGKLLPQNAVEALEITHRMSIGHAAEFANGGWSFDALLGASPFLILFGATLLRRTKPALKRDASDLFGSARFATTAELGQMQDGLELGRNPDTGRPVRFAVQGTLATIAPPRKGKTSGLLIPRHKEPRG